MNAGIVQQSSEKKVKANGIDLVYDTFGDPSNPPILLIMGLGGQMIAWDERFCKMLVDQGFWVIRFDNRDIGQSTHFTQAGVPNILGLLQGQTVEVPYRLMEMAQDAVGLLDALDIDKAHIVGASMGGMIAQEIAIHYPERVHTLTSMISTTGDPQLPTAKPEVLAMLITPASPGREGAIENGLKIWRVLSGPKYPMDEADQREREGTAFDREADLTGVARQFAAIMASGSRKEGLQSVHVPALVIHGSADPLVPVEGGIATAEAIAGSKLEIFEGMGHQLPPEIWPRLVELIVSNAARAA